MGVCVRGVYIVFVRVRAACGAVILKGCGGVYMACNVGFSAERGMYELTI